MSKFSIGLDFGTEAVRAIIVGVKDGRIAGQGVHVYAHGVIDRELPNEISAAVPLPADFAFQHPQDWLDSAAIACREALAVSDVRRDDVIGVGVAFTSCTMLPTLRDGTPLCLVDQNLAQTPMAWPKLWKHHGAKAETDRMNQIARDRREPWLARYGGNLGLEYFFPKILETLERAPGIYDRAEVWLEAGDWFVWQLIDGPFPRCHADHLIRSTCQAGYKATWSEAEGYPSAEFFAAVHPKMADVVAKKMPGQIRAPGTKAGALSVASAELLGLPAGIPVSAVIIDAHAGVPGVGAGADALVLVLGTSACHMLNSHHESFVPGVAGVVRNGILPGLIGYETGQASVGDAFAWLAETFNLSHAELNQKAQKLAPMSGGVLALDWFSGCRTPLMDGRLSGGFLGLTLGTRPEQMYRALMEATAFGVRWIVNTFRDGGVPVQQIVAAGGLPSKSPLLMQIYADVLNEPITVGKNPQSVALGAAILGAIAAEPSVTGLRSVEEAIAVMAPQVESTTYQPASSAVAVYDAGYALYHGLIQENMDVKQVMRRLREIAAGEYKSAFPDCN